MLRPTYPHVIDPGLIAQAATSAVGGKPARLTRLKQNQSRVIYEVSLRDGRRAYLKAETLAPGKSFSLALEAWALEQASSLGLPVPLPLALDCSESRFPFRWLLLSAVPGIHLTRAGLPAESEASLLRECGALLTRLHTIAVGGFGSLDDELYLEKGAIRGSSPTWRSFLLEQATGDAASLTSSGLLSEAEAEDCLHRIAAGAPHLGQGHLIHGDFDRSHIFVDAESGRLTGVIDFGARESADPEWEFSWPWIFDAPPTATAMIEGYRHYGGWVEDRLLECYILVRLLWLARWRHDRRDPAAGEALQRLRARLSVP